MVAIRKPSGIRRAISVRHCEEWKDHCLRSQQRLDIDRHHRAEIHAIRTACKKLKTIDLSGCTIYSTCEPCPMCFSACHWARISKIVFGARIRDARAAGFHELSISNRRMKSLGASSVKLVEDVLRHEALNLFRIWAGQSRSRPY
jgi:tRNA(Arg) A34 adenosine deaminase TadA